MIRLIIALILFSSATSFATPTILECSFPSLSKQGKFYISVNNFSTPKNVELYYSEYTDYEGNEAAFSYDGEELEWLWSLALSGDGQAVELDKKGNMSFFLDSDGCDVGEIYLYKNSGFKFGYVSVKHHCSGPGYPDSYSKARCVPVK